MLYELSVELAAIKLNDASNAQQYFAPYIWYITPSVRNYYRTILLHWLQQQHIQLALV